MSTGALGSAYPSYVPLKTMLVTAAAFCVLSFPRVHYVRDSVGESKKAEEIETGRNLIKNEKVMCGHCGEG